MYGRLSFLFLFALASGWAQIADLPARLKALETHFGTSVNSELKQNCHEPALAQCEDWASRLAGEIADDDRSARTEAIAGVLRTLRELEGNSSPATMPSAGLALMYGRTELILGKLPEAASSLEEAKPAFEKLAGPESGFAIGCYSLLAQVYIQQNKDTLAEPLLLRTLAVLRRGDNDMGAALILTNLARVYEDQGLDEKAVPMLQEAWEIRKRELGESNRFTLVTENDLAALYDTMGLYAEAEPLYRQALAIAEKTKAGDDLLAKLLNNLADLYHTEKLFGKSEPLYVRALGIMMRSKSDPQDIATVMDNLAGLYDSEGDFSRAEQQHLRALGIRSEALGDNNPLVALSLNNLGTVYYDRGDYAKAAAKYEQSLAIRQSQPQPMPSDISQSLDNLGQTFDKQKKFADAESLYLRALEIRAKASNDDDTGHSFYHLGSLYMEGNEYTRAEPYLEKALALLTRILGANHSDTLDVQISYAIDLWKIGKYQASRNHLLAANRGLSDFWSRNLLSLNQAGRARLVGQFRRLVPVSLTAAVELYRADRAGATMLAALAIGTRKGVQSSATLEIMAQVRRDKNPETGRILQQMMANADQQVTESRKISPDASAGLAKLQRKAAELESRLMAKSAGYREWRKPVEPSLVSSHLKPGTAFIDILRFEVDSDSGELGYAAVVYRAGKGPRFVVLGPALQIEKAVDNLRLNFENMWRSCTSTDSCTSANQKVLISGTQFGANLANTEKDCALLYRLTMGKLREALGEDRRLIISPDEKLASVPWEILRSGDGRYLIESGYRISYLDSLRSLIYPPPNTEPRSEAVVIAEVNYDGDPLDKPVRRSTVSEQEAFEGSTLELSAGGPIGPWKRLSGGSEILGTFRELGGKLGPIKKLVLGSKQEVLALQQPSAMFVHTHGYFLSQPRGADDGLGSGIALYGANLPMDPDSQHRNGLLTAKEVMLLNLDGTRLVALLGCDTGRGTAAGEGVQGLRHAIAVAGARSSLLSLWEVGDLSTARFLKELLLRSASIGNKPIEEAHAETQMAFLHSDVREPNSTAASNRWRHPYFWAAATLAGQGGVLNFQFTKVGRDHAN